jgi:hypothetical protein
MFFKSMKNTPCMEKMVGAGILNKLEPKPDKNGPAPQHCLWRRLDLLSGCEFNTTTNWN